MVQITINGKQIEVPEGTTVLRAAETAGIKKAFGGHAWNMPISSLKSMCGQALAASSAMQVVASCLNEISHHGTQICMLRDLYRQRYAGESLIRILDDAPWVSRIAGRHGVEIGGFTVAPGGKRLVLVATLDNLLKGAATNAVQIAEVLHERGLVRVPDRQAA